jgi:hypothetical protein
MRRVLVYGDHEVERWTLLADSCTGIGVGDIVAQFQSPATQVNCDLLAAGRRAFALREVAHERRVIEQLITLWTPTLRDLSRRFLVQAGVLDQIVSQETGT